MFYRFPLIHCLVLASFAFLTACGGSDAAKNIAPKSVDERFAIKVGEHTVRMQIVAQSGELERGLMFRKSLGADEGMLFVFPSPTQMGFWMRNTEIPLNIGFFDARGELKETYEMYPHDDRRVTSHARDLQFALEMNQGWYRQAGVKPGAKLDLKAVAEALKARGLKPAAWGLR